MLYSAKVSSMELNEPPEQETKNNSETKLTINILTNFNPTSCFLRSRISESRFKYG